MKTTLQILVLLLAILIGILWETFKPEIHNLLRLPESLAKSSDISVQTMGSPEVPPATNPSTLTVEKKSPATEPRKPAKAASSKLKNEAVKVVSTPAAPSIPADPMPNDSYAIKDQQAQIQRIVEQRYPDIPNIPFSEKYPDLDKLPPDTFPERIQTHQQLNFKLTQQGKTVAMSSVKAGGFVHPQRVEEDKITVSSLANKEMTQSLSLSETDFTAVIEANYNAALERALTRLEEMRKADQSDLLKNFTLYKKVSDGNKVWEDPEAKHFDYVKSEAKQKLAGSPYRPVAFFANGDIRIDDDGPYSGVYYVIIVLIEGSDTGFGPYHWSAKCFLRNGEIVGWTGMPKL